MNKIHHHITKFVTLKTTEICLFFPQHFAHIIMSVKALARSNVQLKVLSVYT